MNPTPLGAVNVMVPKSDGQSHCTLHTGAWHCANWTSHTPGVTTHGGTIGQGAHTGVKHCTSQIDGCPVPAIAVTVPARIKMLAKAIAIKSFTLIINTLLS
jgi:hypothetical protein